MIKLPSEGNSKIEVTVENMTDNDIVLCSRTTLGLLHNVAAIYPLQEKSAEEQTPQASDCCAAPPAPAQQSSGECDVFAKDDWDTGCIKDLEMEIQLKYNVPVQRTYNAIP